MNEFFKGGSKEQRESGMLEVLPAEQRVLESLTPQDVEIVRRLKRENILREKEHVVGIRSEDLIHFLECVHLGYIPIGSGGFRERRTENGYLFVTTNSESSLLRTQHPDLIPERLREELFRVTAQTNVNVYAQTAMIQAVRREIMPYVDEPALVEQKRLRLQRDQDEPVLESVAREELYRDIVLDIEDQSSYTPATRSLMALLRGKPEILSRCRRLYDTAEKRGGILLAFGDELVRRFSGTTDPRLVHDTKETIYAIPDGRLPLATLQGFEPLGEFEDGVLELLGIE